MLGEALRSLPGNVEQAVLHWAEPTHAVGDRKRTTRLFRFVGAAAMHHVASEDQRIACIHGGTRDLVWTSSTSAVPPPAGDIHTQEVRVDLNGAVTPDFVFEEDYELRNIEETEEYIQTYKHLPEIPSGSEMEKNGFELKEMNLKLLQKVEELTLYLIEQNKEIQNLKKDLQEIKSRE